MIGNDRGKANKGRKFKPETIKAMSLAKKGSANKKHKWTSGLEHLDPRPHPTKRGLWLARELNDKKQKAISRNKKWNLTSIEAGKILISPCFYCGQKNDAPNMGIDRINNSIDYIASNCVPCCFSCNSAKGTKSFDEFKKWAEMISARLSFWGAKERG